MDDRVLETLLRDLESPASERKGSFADRDRVCQAICAFANDMASSGQPGYIFIGAKDDGSPAGTQITDELLLNLTALRSDGRILPQPRMLVEKRVLLGAPMAVIGDLFSVLRLLDELAKELVAAKPVAVSGLREELVFEYPVEALRESLVNAVIHRDYESNTPTIISIFEDRIEIQNPGSLYGDARLEDFPGVTAYRNPVIAEAAKVLGYVNRFGRGLPRILESMQKNGSSPPRIEPKSGHFLVVLPRHT